MLPQSVAVLPRELGRDLVHLAEPPHRDQERFVVVQARGLEVPDLLAQVPLQLVGIRVVDSASAQHRCTPLPDLVLQRVHGHAPIAGRARPHSPPRVRLAVAHCLR